MNYKKWITIQIKNIDTGIRKKKEQKKNRREKIKKYIWQNYKGNLTKKEIEKNRRKEIEKEKET